MSRRSSDEIQFGSDSFMDVVANIVGILVILIVIVGLRVSRAPVRIDESPAAEETTAAVEIDPPILPLLAADPPPEPEPAPPQPPALPPPPPLPPEPPAELVREAERRSRRLASLREDLQRTEKLSQTQQSELDALRRHVDQLRQRHAGEKENLTSESQRVGRLRDSLDATARQLDVLREQVETAETELPPTTEVRHRVSPVARVVEGDELHFRLAANRVSVIPIETLSTRLQEHVLRHREAIVKLERYEGSVGPCDGYQMDYVVERQSLGLVEELKYGRGMVRFGVSRWTVVPGRDLPDESADEALKPSSRFAMALRKAGPRTTLTFWVYPDSFALHRQLQEAAHENGFEVAARPLPAGIPITGAPNGSRSFAQ